MRIAQVPPLYESVPPQRYGGTERVVSYLTEELVKKGHQVTLFASGDSVTSGNLVPCCPRSLRLDESCVAPLAHHVLQLGKVFEDAASFDIIHFHNDYLHFPMSKQLKRPNVTTLHGRLDLPDLSPLYQHYRDVPLISISNSQRKPLSFANWQATVYHGLPDGLFTFRKHPGNYLAFVGRISPEKGVDKAIEISRRVGMELKLAAKVDRSDREYFEDVISPLFDDPLVEFVGEIGHEEKNDLLGGAYALLFPINWPEPFGLVMIESMACGTPIIAYPGGSVAEVIQEGETGFIVQDVDAAIEAVERVAELDREKCRGVFERRFTAARMAEDYIAAYSRVMGEDVRSAPVIPAGCSLTVATTLSGNG